MHFITQVISVSNKKKKTKKNLPSTRGEFARIYLIVQHDTAYFPSLSPLSTTTCISHFFLHHSHCIHWILLTAPGRNNSFPRSFPVALFVSSWHLPEYSDCTVLRSALLQTLCGTSVAPTQHTGCGFSSVQSTQSK